MADLDAERTISDVGAQNERNIGTEKCRYCGKSIKQVRGENAFGDRWEKWTHTNGEFQCQVFATPWTERDR